MEKITKEEFLNYEEVRESGVTNMFCVKTVMSLSGLTKDKILEIMNNYGDLQNKYCNDSI